MILCEECKEELELIDEDWLCNFCDLRLEDEDGFEIPHEDVTVGFPVEPEAYQPIPLSFESAEAVVFNPYSTRHD